MDDTAAFKNFKKYISSLQLFSPCLFFLCICQAIYYRFSFIIFMFQLVAVLNSQCILEEVMSPIEKFIHGLTKTFFASNILLNSKKN